LVALENEMQRLEPALVELTAESAETGSKVER
jgi:hypothetical protein